MSFYIHIGQCGIQLGEAYWQLAAQTYPTHIQEGNAPHTINRKSIIAQRTKLFNRLHMFHRKTGAGRCIFIDSEAKLLQKYVQKTKFSSDSMLKSFKPAHVHYEYTGRGNVWAMGYMNKRNSVKKPAFNANTSNYDAPRDLCSLTMESARKEMESIDCFKGFVIMQSLGGGTGAGLGCRVLETFRNEFGQKPYILSVAIAPNTGNGVSDTPLQSYNTIFTLKHLQEYTDCIVYKDNANALRSALAFKMHRDINIPSKYPSSVSMEELNQAIATDIGGLLFPIHNSSDGMLYCGTMASDIGSIVYDLCPMPSLKFIDVQSGIWSFSNQYKSPRHSELIWNIKQVGLKDMNIKNVLSLSKATARQFSPTSRTVFASNMIVRGWTPTSSSVSSSTTALQNFMASTFQPIYLGKQVSTIQYSAQAPFLNTENQISTTIALNNGHFQETTSEILTKAKKLLQAKAYLHWYEQYGMEESEFHHAIDHCERILDSYKIIK